MPVRVRIHFAKEKDVVRLSFSRDVRRAVKNTSCTEKNRKGSNTYIASKKETEKIGQKERKTRENILLERRVRSRRRSETARIKRV